MSRMTVQDWAVTILYLARVVQHDYLCMEVLNTCCGLVLRVRGYVSPLYIFHRHILHNESNVVTRKSFLQGLVMHLHRLDLAENER